MSKSELLRRKEPLRKNSSPDAVNGTGSTAAFENLRNGIEARLQKQKTQKPCVAGKEGKSTISTKQDSQPRGKKRSHTGQVVTDGRSEVNEDAAFEAEVRALGGSKEDTEFLADAQSDSEVEGTDALDPSKRQSSKSTDLQKGMSNILKEIALAQGEKDDAEDADAESKSEEEPDVQTPALESVHPTKQPKGKKGKSKLKAEPRSEWFADIDAFDAVPVAKSPQPASQDLEQIQDYAENLLKEDNEIYREERQHGSSQSFYNTVIASGTLSDKISALTLAAQESPIHNVKALETLIALSKKRSRAQAVDVLRALKDLFAQGSLLPGSRRLYSFITHPVILKAFAKKKPWARGDRLPRGLEDHHLIACAFESWLKDQYFEILKTLEVWCNDEIEYAKSKALSYVFELLKEKPEQESNLLRLLVNKLGDPVKKIASQASYLLRELLQIHPAMRDIVISAIETDFIFRPGQSLHGKYYAAITLNQTALSTNQEDLAIKLLNIYFGLFAPLLKLSENAASDDAGAKSFSRSQRRRGTREQDSGQAQSDELREKLTSAVLTGVNRAYPYAGADNQKFAKHMDTLFKIVHSANFNTSIQAMLLIQQLSTSYQPSSDRFYRVLYETLFDPRLIVASKQQMYLNLLHRSLKADMNIKRVKAFVKRIIQVLTLHEPPFICGAFFLLKDLDSSFPGLTALIDQPEEADEEEQQFQDAEDAHEPLGDSKPAQVLSTNVYDAHKRAPEFANADNSCAWELGPFLAHFHPSVLASVEQYTRHRKLPGKPDLTLHTLIHFLDRFVYKNAKESDGKMHGSSIMQPLASDNTRAVLLNPTAGAQPRQALNTEEFRAKKLENVAAEDVFFHQYFQSLGQDPKKTKKQKQTEVDDFGSDDEDAVWNAMMKSAPELDMDEDDDLSVADLESDMGSYADEDVRDDAAAEQSEGSGVDVEAGIFDDSDDEMADIAGDDVEAGSALAELESDDGLLEDVASDHAEEVGTKQLPKTSKDKDRRKKLKSLPIFASADDYAKMLDDDEDEDME